jgi:hypothetical protein
MCKRYPDCIHAGPVMKKVDGVDRYCETLLLNANCPYHGMGCLGCTYSARAMGGINLTEAARLCELWRSRC